MRLSKRLSDLEKRGPVGAVRWRRIFQYEDQSQAEALAAYEAENGPIGPDEGRILRVFIHKPFPAPQGH
jgi:hypothetical protein